jgi:hypothetical protein
MGRIAELRFDQNCAIRNIGLTITRDQPAPQRWRIVDLNIRVHPIGGADLRIMFPGLVNNDCLETPATATQRRPMWQAEAAYMDWLRERRARTRTPTGALGGVPPTFGALEIVGFKQGSVNGEMILDKCAE